MMKRLHCIVSGDVQGVGYRSWTKRQAKRLNVTGWVRNREDGMVELIAEGDEQALRDLLTACRHGPEVAWVESVSEDWHQATGEFAAFSVLY